MTTNNTARYLGGERVFPVTDAHCYPTGEPGLSKREWLSGILMQGILSNVQYWDVGTTYAEVAVSQADALLAELAKKPEGDAS